MGVGDMGAESSDSDFDEPAQRSPRPSMNPVGESNGHSYPEEPHLEPSTSSSVSNNGQEYSGSNGIIRHSRRPADLYRINQRGRAIRRVRFAHQFRRSRGLETANGQPVNRSPVWIEVERALRAHRAQFPMPAYSWAIDMDRVANVLQSNVRRDNRPIIEQMEALNLESPDDEPIDEPDENNNNNP